jgi:hypothetical protein
LFDIFLLACVSLTLMAKGLSKLVQSVSPFPFADTQLHTPVHIQLHSDPSDNVLISYCLFWFTQLCLACGTN